MTFEILHRNEVCGEGMYATEPIPYDHVIVRESPLFTIDLGSVRTRVSKEDVFNALCKLTEDEKRMFKRLFGDNDMMRWSQNHFVTNPSNKKRQTRGIYPQCAKLNHSCTPNAVREYNDDHTVSLVCIRPIAKGQEITITYLADHQLFFPRTVRSTLLRKQGIFTERFQCMCTSCQRSDDGGDMNRRLIKELIPNNTPETSREVWQMLEQEKLSARLLFPEEALLLVFPKGIRVSLKDRPGVVCGHNLQHMRLCVQFLDNVEDKVWVSHSEL